MAGRGPRNPSSCNLGLEGQHLRANVSLNWACQVQPYFFHISPPQVFSVQRPVERRKAWSQFGQAEEWEFCPNRAVGTGGSAPLPPDEDGEAGAPVPGLSSAGEGSPAGVTGSRGVFLAVTPKAQGCFLTSAVSRTRGSRRSRCCQYPDRNAGHTPS